jgi:hypothetical protein
LDDSGAALRALKGTAEVAFHGLLLEYNRARGTLKLDP